MALILSVFLGISLAASLHWFSWWVRLNRMPWTLVLGGLGAIGVTALGLVYVLTSDISHLVLPPLILFWVAAALLGALQAGSIPAPWWVGILGLLFEMSMGFLGLSITNLSLRKLILQWRLAERIPEVFGRPEIIRDQMIYIFLITAAALALIRTILRMRRR